MAYGRKPTLAARANVLVRSANLLLDDHGAVSAGANGLRRVVRPSDFEQDFATVLPKSEVAGPTLRKKMKPEFP